MDRKRKSLSKNILKNALVAQFLAAFQKISIEKKSIFISQIGVFLFCFFPWIQITINAGGAVGMGDSRVVNFFSPGNVAFFIILSILFLSITILSVFIDDLLKLKKIKFPFSLNHVYLFSCSQQLIFLLLAISSLLILGNRLGDVSILFGFFVCFVFVLMGLIGTFLEMKNEKKQNAQEFFQNPSTVSDKKEALISHSSNPTKESPINHIDKD